MAHRAVATMAAEERRLTLITLYEAEPEKRADLAHLFYEAALARHAEMAQGFAAQPSRLIRHVVIDGLPSFVPVEAGHRADHSAPHQGPIECRHLCRTPSNCATLPEAHIQ